MNIVVAESSDAAVDSAGRQEVISEVPDDRGGVALTAREVVVDALEDHDLGYALTVRTELVGRAVLVVFAGEEQQRSIELPELRCIG